MIRYIFTAIGFAITAPFASARESYIDGFINHWSSTFRNQNSIVMLALGVGVVGIFIITRGKWKK